MSGVVVETEPDIAPGSTDDDDLIHVVCCDPARALCGADLRGTGAGWSDPDVDDPDDCVVCTDLKGGTCGAAFCGLRVRWRWSRWGKFGRGTPP